MRILVHLCSSCLLIKYFSFYFVASVFDCIVAEIVSFLSRKISGQEFPDSQKWVYFFHICGCDFCKYGFIFSIFVDVIFVILPSSTRLEYY